MEPIDHTGGFGGLEMGDTWFYHYGYHNHQSTRGLVAREASLFQATPRLSSWGQVMNRKGPYQPKDKFFGMRPGDDEVASTGHNPTADRGEDRYNPNDPMLPVAWTKSYEVPGGKSGRVFAATRGASTDLLSAGMRRMLVNGVYWSLGLEGQISENETRVDLVGDYTATPIKFEGRDFWKTKGIRPAAFALDMLKLKFSKKTLRFKAVFANQSRPNH
ncbi:MAG: hypothetical protein ACKV19_24140 [Verrucomicrobiales bacterium]